MGVTTLALLSRPYKPEYAAGSALVFHNIDYLMMTIKLLRKDYIKLARYPIPIGAQVGMTEEQRANKPRSKIRRFGERAVQARFYGKEKSGKE